VPAHHPLKGILFDKDGTLIDYHLTWGPINREAAALAACGDVALERRLLEAGGMDPATGLTRADSLLAAGHTYEIADGWIAAGSPLQRDDLARQLDALFTRSATRSVPIMDLAMLFTGLRRDGYAVGIASSDSEAAIRRMLAHFGLADLTDFVAGYDSGHGGKPEPGMLLAFARAIGAQPGEIAMVGDNGHDMKMGRAAGAGLCIGVLSGTGGSDDLTPLSDLIISDISMLRECLNAALDQDMSLLK